MKEINLSSPTYHKHKVQTFMPSTNNPFRLLLIAIRLCIFAVCMGVLIVFQDYIRPNIMVPAIRRYLSCVVNLLTLRVVLFILGFLRFECENFKYFSKGNRMLNFKSGWIGVASHKNIIDYFYFTYLFSPVYVKVIQHKSPDSSTLYYSPMTFKQSFFSALSYRGFDPIIVHSQVELKKIKRRKMMMQTIVSECFQQSNGPILIMLPGVCPNQHLKVHENIGKDIFENQRKFVRSGVVFVCETNIEQQKRYSQNNRHFVEYYDKIYPNQSHFLIQVCSEVRSNIFTVSAHETISKYMINPLERKLEYKKQTLSEFIDEYYSLSGLKINNLSYEQYLSQVESLDREIRMHQKSILHENDDKEKYA